MMAKDEASRGLGIELIDQDEGRAVTRMTVRDDMVNGHAIAHGGLIFTLADTAFACACNSFGPVTVASSADIVFVAPARAGDVLVAEAVLRTRFGRAGLYDVTVRRGGEVIAEFRGRGHELCPARTARRQWPRQHRRAAAAQATTWRRCSRWPSRSSTSAATTARACEI